MSKRSRPPRKKPATLVAEAYCPLCEGSFPEALERCPNDGARLIRLAQKEASLVGTLFDGRFEFLDVLGDGGMGAVYLAKEVKSGRKVAIKLIKSELTNDIGVSKRFLREARVSSGLNHPNTVTVFDYGQTDEGILFLVMEFLEGETLEAVLTRERRLKPRRVAHVGCSVLDALERAHEQNVIHRDLKPANIMLVRGEGGEELVKVLDFGLAKSLGSDFNTTAGFLMGTPAYLAPEVILHGDIQFGSDLYAVGVLLYEILSGRVPFEDEEIPAVLMAHAHRPPPPLPFDIPRSLATFVGRLLKKKPEDRYPSARAAREALMEAIEDLSDTERSRVELAATDEITPLSSTAWLFDEDTGTVRTQMSFPANTPVPDPASSLAETLNPDAGTPTPVVPVGKRGKVRRISPATKTKQLTPVPPLYEMQEEILSAVAYDQSISKEMQALIFDSDSAITNARQRMPRASSGDSLDVSTNRMKRSIGDSDEITARRQAFLRNSSVPGADPALSTDIVRRKPKDKRVHLMLWLVVATAGVFAGAVTWWLLGR